MKNVLAYHISYWLTYYNLPNLPKSNAHLFFSQIYNRKGECTSESWAHYIQVFSVFPAGRMQDVVMDISSDAFTGLGLEKCHSLYIWALQYLPLNTGCWGQTVEMAHLWSSPKTSGWPWLEADFWI